MELFCWTALCLPGTHNYLHHSSFYAIKSAVALAQRVEPSDTFCRREKTNLGSKPFTGPNVCNVILSMNARTPLQRGIRKTCMCYAHRAANSQNGRVAFANKTKKTPSDIQSDKESGNVKCILNCAARYKEPHCSHTRKHSIRVFRDLGAAEAYS